MLNTVVEDLGLVDYESALDHQLRRLKEVQEDPNKQFIIACSHPPVATLGRKTLDDDHSDWQGERFEVQRGGRVTYHGPNQIVIYPILNLSEAAPKRAGLKARDLHGYLRLLEQVVVDVLAEYGVDADREPLPGFLGQFVDVEPTGVWVENRKICSVGIGVKKWVTFHGLALNVLADQSAFVGLKPCGFASSVMTSLQGELRSELSAELFMELSKADVQSKLLARLQECLK